MYVFMAKELRFAIILLLLLQIEVEDSSEIEPSIVNKSTPFIHKIPFCSFFLILFRADKSHHSLCNTRVLAHICVRVCAWDFYTFDLQFQCTIRLFHFFYLRVCVEGRYSSLLFAFKQCHV